MAIEGSLADVGLADISQLLSLGRKTGCLTVTDRSNFGYIYFEKGRVVYASVLNRPDRLNAVNWALATDLIPKEEAGKYLGLSNLATAGAGAAARLGGPLIDGVNALRPGEFLGYPALFVLASLCTLTGTLLLRRIEERRI